MVSGTPAKKFQEDYRNKQLRDIRLKKGYEYMTAKQAAEVLHVTQSKVSALCRGGHFEGAFKIGTSWRIPVRREGAPV